MIVNKRTKNKTDVINFKDGTRIYLEIGDNEVDDKYKDELMDSILFKTSGIKISEHREEVIGEVKVEASKASKASDDELVALRKEAKELGVKFHPAIGKEKLTIAIEAKKDEIAKGEIDVDTE